MDKLYITIPAYNESENIEEVIKEWHEVVENISLDSRLVVTNDGSKDNTFEILKNLEEKYSQLIALTKENGGHGDTVLFGYNYALNNNADYIFQTDSDGQTRPEEFYKFWDERKNSDIIIGHRSTREDGASRVFVTKTLKLVLKLMFKEDITDANTPFRLMESKILKKHLKNVPEHFNLSNVILTVSFLKEKEKVVFYPITFRPRQGGVNSINLKSITKIGIQAVKDFKVIKKNLKKK